MKRHIDIADAKATLTALVEEAADGCEIVIERDGVPLARLCGLAPGHKFRVPAGALKLSYLSPDFDALDPELIEALEDGPVFPK